MSGVLKKPAVATYESNVTRTLSYLKVMQKGSQTVSQFIKTLVYQILLDLFTNKNVEI